MLPAQQRIKANGSSAIRQVWCPNVEEICRGFLLSVKTESDIDVEHKRLIESKLTFGLTLQPHIVYVEDNQNVFLSVNEELYKCSNLLYAFEALLKFHMALNISYNFESQHVLEFIQKYFYDIKTDCDSNNKSVLSLLAELNVMVKTANQDANNIIKSYII